MDNDPRYQLGLAWPSPKKKDSEAKDEKPTAATPVRKPRKTSA